MAGIFGLKTAKIWLYLWVLGAALPTTGSVVALLLTLEHFSLSDNSQRLCVISYLTAGSRRPTMLSNWLHAGVSQRPGMANH